MATPYERIAEARSRLVTAGIPPADATFDAELLARHALNWDRFTLLIHGREPEPADFPAAYQPLIDRRANREPIAQIVGHREFWGLEFEVTPDVLVPRPETELIVEEALAFAREHECRTVIDVGTGSGCIAVAIAHELPSVRVTAVDASEAALRVARRNAERHSVADRVTFLQSNLFEQVHGKADLIVANPPYVPTGHRDTLQPEVVRFEPHAALFGGGQDGLDMVRRILAAAAPHLAPGGRLILEFGFGQDTAVQEAAAAADWTVLNIRPDLQEIRRTIVLSRESLSRPHSAS